MCAAIAIEEVSVNHREPDGLRGCRVDARGGDDGVPHGVDVLSLEGWVVGADTRVVGVEFSQFGNSLGQIPLEARRPDVAVRLPGIPNAEVSGFRALIGALTLTKDFKISVKAVLEDDTEVEIATVTGRRSSVRSRFRPSIQPLMITTLGRSGSTVLVRVLGAHPAIACLDDDSRVANHWIQTLSELADPPRYLRRLLPSSQPGPNSTGWWVGTRAPIPSSSADREVQDLLYATGAEELATFVQERIDAVYRRGADSAGCPDARYYVEKHHPTVVPSIMWELYPEAKEIILVRDFRDFFCSVVAYNSRIGVSGFGAELQPDAEHHIRWLSDAAERLALSWQERSAQAHLLRYEDLVLDPSQELERLLKYLELPASDGVIDAMTGTLFETVAGGEDHRTSPSARESIGRWRQDLSPELRRLAEEEFSTGLSIFGYA